MFRELLIKIKLLRQYGKKTLEIRQALSDKEIVYCLILHRVVRIIFCSIFYFYGFLYIVVRQTFRDFNLQMQVLELIQQGVVVENNDISVVARINALLKDWSNSPEEERKQIHKRLFTRLCNMETGQLYYFRVLQVLCSCSKFI